MYYCFVVEDIKNIDESNPLKLQVNYAEVLGKCIYCSLEENKLIKKDNEEIFLNNDLIFLRSTCDNFQKAAEIITSKSGILIESVENIEIIENWAFYINTTRDIYCIDVKELYDESVVSKIRSLAKGKEYIFIKSLKKGFSAIISMTKIIENNQELQEFLIKKCEESGSNSIIISPYYEIKKDSLGKKEARFFVFGNQILNCSRNLHSIKHIVPKKIISNAYNIIEKIKTTDNFPENYVLDLVEFFDGEDSFVDIVEFNPITTSMCYVNNSIFAELNETIKEAYEKLKMGYEYCYDYTLKKERYVLSKCVGESYEYKNDERWTFI